MDLKTEDIEQFNISIPTVQVLLDKLHAERIKYCHWKSNEHLENAVKGNTDLDILFDKEDYTKVKEILEVSGFIKFDTVWYREYPGIEDFVGIDSEQNKIVHVHAHFGLVLGEKFVKSYEWPWNNDLLKQRVWDDKYKIYRSNTVHESILLVCREALKLSKSLIQKFRDSNNIFLSDPGILKEYRWLKERVSTNDLLHEASRLVGDKATHIIEDIFVDGITERKLKKLQSILIQEFKPYRRYSTLGVFFQIHLRHILILFSRLLKKLGFIRWTNRRTLPMEGVIIAVMGSDGSGKSTVCEKIVGKLNEKVDATFIYMGSGKGKCSWYRRPLMKMRQRYINSKSLNKDLKDSGREENKKNKSIIRRLLSFSFRILWAVSLAKERERKLKRAWKAREHGWFVVCDRYPQTQIEGYNDGPKLGEIKFRFPGYNWLKNWERKCYSLAYKYPADLVINLYADEATLKKRRPDMSIAELRRKQEGIKKLTFPENTTVVHLDSSKEVIDTLKDSLFHIKENFFTKTSYLK